MKWMVIWIWIKIFTYGVEDDGQINYMLTTPRGVYSISFSSKEILPFSEWVQARVGMECEDGFTYDEDSIHGPIARAAYHCNAGYLITDQGFFRGME